jgi:catechol 2,3-dioxygenase-like lactoylglutathione lyase family enzyme
MTKLSTIGQVAMPVRDLARAVAFYRDRLGIEFLFQAPPGLAFFKCGSVRLLVEVPPEKAFQRPDRFFTSSSTTSIALTPICANAAWRFATRRI